VSGVLLVCVLVMLLTGAVQADDATSAPISTTAPTIRDDRPEFQTNAGSEQELADRYAPIVYLRQVNNDICDTENEGFDPVSVEFVLGQPDIPLLDTENGRPTGARRTIAESPTAADLYGLDQPHFLDFPGSPVRPRCDYRRYVAARVAAGGVEYVAYAHIYHEPDTDELALQYWLFYYFNDWNNSHEGDWEMVMLFFDATTVEEALAQEPTRTVYAQHGGGERADWDDDKLSKEDGHPVVYVARGAHASFYEQHTYLGLVENGTGLGCETTKGPHRRIALEAVVVPHAPTGPEDQFAWLGFTGRWGEFRRSEWNGPTGPNAKTSWAAPVSWADGVRDTSLIVPEFEGFGQAPVGLFCGAVAGGSWVLVAFSRTPVLVVGGIGLVLVALGWVYSTSSASVRRAHQYYRRHLRTFGFIGAMLIPAGYIVAILQTLAFQVPPIEPLVGMTQRFPGVRIFVILALGSMQAVLAIVFVAPTVIWTMSQIRDGRVPGVLEAYRHGVREIVPIFLTRVQVTVRIILRALTIVGLPRAIRQIIQATFIAQAIVHERDDPDEAVRDSARAADVNLTRTVLTQVVLNVITLLTGPLVTIVLLLAIPSRPLDLINFISSFIFAFLYPFGVIGMTLLYFELRPEPGNVAVEPIELAR
jgi:hypothetical protein